MLTDELAAKISPQNIRAYLEKTGWHRKKSLRDDIIVYGRHSDDKFRFYEFKVPVDTKSEFYGETILSSCKRLMEIEGRSLLDVLNRLNSPNIDRLEYRVKSQLCDTGMLELDKVRTLIGSIVGSLKAAAMDISRPGPHHSRTGSSFTSKLIESAKFGQTQPGSFIMNFYIPTGVPSDKSEMFDHSDETMYRGVLEHFMKSLSRAITAIHSNTIEDFAKENERTRLISGNLFSSISKSDIWDDNAIDINIDWSPLYAITDDIPSSVSIGKNDFNNFRSLAKRFQPEAESHKGTFTGYITGLNGFGKVKMTVRTPEGEKMVKAVLNDEDYAKSAQWHVNTIPVLFTGVLRMSNSSGVGIMEEVSDIRELSDSNSNIPVPNKPKRKSKKNNNRNETFLFENEDI